MWKSQLPFSPTWGFQSFLDEAVAALFGLINLQLFQFSTLKNDLFPNALWVQEKVQM